MGSPPAVGEGTGGVPAGMAPKFPIPTHIPGAGGVHTTASDMSRFVRFHLNRGTLDGQTILEPRLLDAMCTTSPILSLTSSTSKKELHFGLCVVVSEKHDSYSLEHGGGGFGFFTQMKWYPEYGIGCIVLTNSMTHDVQDEKITDAILDRLITQKVVTKDARKVCSRPANGHRRIATRPYNRLESRHYNHCVNLPRRG